MREKKSKSNKSYISIYVRNKSITPSSYYRIIQYSKYFDSKIMIREIAPNFIYNKQLNIDRSDIYKKVIIGAIYYIIMVFRCIYFLIMDIVKKPKCVVVSKTFCPRYTPYLLLLLIKRLCKISRLYWDFDDYIFENGEISKKQRIILEKYSKNIIVTNKYLKEKISRQYQDKVKLLATTDGDLQGFVEDELLKIRVDTFREEIRLVWVATSGNLKHLNYIIDTLDEAAFYIKQKLGKNLVLTVVCNKPFKIETKFLIIRNITWSREKAKLEIYNAHIGIMPLIEDEFTLGKGGFKLVQYISTGLPIIASNVGFNKEVINNEYGILVNDKVRKSEWIKSIYDMSCDINKWIEMSKKSYIKWKKDFNFYDNLNFWNEILR